MNRPISDNPDDLDRTDRLPVIGAGESTDEFPAFDPAATVVLDRASHDRLRAAEEQLSQLQVRLVERENENGDLRATLAGRAESQAALEARAEMLRAQLTDRDEEIGPLRASAIRLVELERLHAALQAEQATARDELARVRAELEAWRAEASRGVTEGQALRAGLEAEIDRRSAELRQARDELATRLAAQADVESRRAELAAQLASTRSAAESELATTRARLEAELTALRARLESELLAARTTHESQLGAVRDRLEGDIAAARAELAAERDAQAALRVAQTAIEEQRLKDAARQGDESAQLQLVVAGLQRELAAARDVHQVLERELAAARRESARAVAGLAGLEGQLRDRDLQVETLLERLRTREARGRFDQELRDSSRAAAERALTTLRLPDRLAALEQSMASRVAAAERSETQLAELLHRLAAERALHAESAAASARAAADAAAAQTAARDTARVAAEQAGQLAEIVAVARAAIEAAASQQASLAAEAAARAEAEAEARARAEAEAISRAMEESAAKARAEADARERERAANAAANAATRYLTRLDDESGIVFILSSPRVVVGRGRNCDLQIVESFISGRHALLRLGPDVTIVEDTGSTNGTFVNSKRVQREALRDGDVVSFGRARFRFHARPLLPPPQ
jgi:hypothetical protein